LSERKLFEGHFNNELLEIRHYGNHSSATENPNEFVIGPGLLDLSNPGALDGPFLLGFDGPSAAKRSSNSCPIVTHIEGM
jgi:hypothetical protein